MGESRGGEGVERSVTTDQVAAAVAVRLSSEDREPREIYIQRITEGTFAVSLTIHGEHEPERFIMLMEDGGASYE